MGIWGTSSAEAMVCHLALSQTPYEPNGVGQDSPSDARGVIVRKHLRRSSWESSPLRGLSVLPQNTPLLSSMVRMRSWLGYFFHGTQEGLYHPYLSPSYPAVYHTVVHVKWCDVTCVGLLKQVSLHEMQACARERGTRVMALTGRGRSTSEELSKIWGYHH